jgi:hypothetical protein
MAVNVPNPGTFFQGTADELTALRDVFQKLVNRNDYISSMGGATFLTTQMGLTSGDAAALIATLGNHKNLATHYTGGAQAPALDYRANGEPFWGGN